MPSPSAYRYTILASALLAASVLTACGEKNANAQAPGGTPPPPVVTYVTVNPQNVTVTSELPGRLEATRIAQVRARAAGIVLKRVFQEGSDVKAGDVLFRIDPAPFQASFESTQAAVAKAEANQAQAALKVQRYRPLVEVNAISKQEFDDALTGQKQAEADLATARAARQNARLNLSYATVTAPITGRIGRAQVTEGALVGQGEATPLATIQQLDPIYVTLTQSSTEILRLRQAMASGQLKSAGKDKARVTLVTEDGNTYPQSGTLLFSDMSVDENTGAITLRASFPNPQRFLLPGMFVRAKLEQAVNENAIVVPQQAVMRSPEGASVMLVGADNKVVAQPVKTGSSQGENWIVSQGLKAGDRVIVEGLQKVKPGAAVKPELWQGPGKPAQAGATSDKAATDPAKSAPAKSASN